MMQSSMEDSNEVDSTVIFKQQADQLTTVQNLEDALARYGFTPEDKISRRELVTIFNNVRKAMEPEIFHLANTARYAEAKEMRARFTKIREEFEDLQLNGARKIRNEQQSLFQKAAEEVTAKLSNEHKDQVDNLMATFQDRTLSHDKFRSIQTTNLEQTISKIHVPHVRYSKRLIELFKAEYNLNKNNQYDDAIKVRRMIDKLVPIEEKKFYKHFDESIERRRKNLELEQAQELAKHEENLKKAEWKDIRRREAEMNVAKQRIINHDKDMKHAHLMESKLKAEMSVKPSALWQHRSGYDFTSAALRGQQLMDHVREKKTGNDVFAESLVERHDFVNIPQDTVILSSSSRRK